MFGSIQSFGVLIVTPTIKLPGGTDSLNFIAGSKLFDTTIFPRVASLLAKMFDNFQGALERKRSTP